MKTVVHVSADFPDPFAPGKTAAVANLIESTAGYRHIVYSLNRRNGVLGIKTTEFGENRVSVVYRAPPKGLLLRTRLHAVADWIRGDLDRTGIVPDVIHAHKFTIEGLIGLRLKATYPCPLVCNIQGNSDTEIAERRPDLRRFYRELALQSSRILSFAPWSGPALERILGMPLGYQLLPVGTTCDRLVAPILSTAPRLVSLFHLDAWRLKGADNLAESVMQVCEQWPDLTLDIYGGGTDRQTRALRAAIAARGATGRVRLMGPLSRDRLQQTLNSYSAFVMPSHRETYGMAFVEALFSGTPVVFPRDRAIDGILPEVDIGSGCDPSSVADLTRAITHVLTHEAELKNRLGIAHAAGALDDLRLTSITTRYRNVLEAVLSGTPVRTRAALQQRT